MENKSLAVVTMSSAFERRRQEAMAKATLEQAAFYTHNAGEQVKRAFGLLTTATAMDPAPRREATAQAISSLKSARALLDEVIGEVDS